MVVKFISLSFANILSFGANPITIEFSKGLNIITGKNGNGKSSIFDSLSYCLYGKPYRDIKIESLINRRNKKNMYVECKFSVNDKTIYVIKRGLKPDILEITKDGEKFESLSAKKLVQEEIDKIIGIDYNLFKQVISVAINFNKPFLSLSKGEKRTIVERIFNIIIFGDMLKIQKKKNADDKLQSELIKKEFIIHEENMKVTRRKLIELTDAEKNFNQNKQNELNNVNSQIDKANEERKELIKIKDKLNLDYENLPATTSNISELKTNRDKIIKDISGYEYQIKTSKSTIKSFDNMSICPTCNNNITDEHKNKEITKLQNIISTAESTIFTLKEKMEIVDDNISTVDKLQSSKREIESNLNRINDKIKYIDTNITNLKNRINEITNRTFDVDLIKMNEEFEQDKIKYKDLHNKKKKYEETIKNNDIISNILSDSGIKSFFLKELIPILNSKINDYLRLFELPILFKFDDAMDEHIFDLNNIKNKIDYNSYSEGEKKRVDISLLLSFINMTKSISNWNTNIILLDEILDTSIDSEGLDKMINCLKNITNNDNTCIYIISHRFQKEDTDQLKIFDHKIHVSKNSNGFSTIS